MGSVACYLGNTRLNRDPLLLTDVDVCGKNQILSHVAHS